MRTENLAVMFTDIQGFTATTARQTHAENELLLRRHDALLGPVVRAFGGRRVKTIGDAWLVVFRSPTSSVLCGMAVQDRLWDYNRRVEEADRIRVRVAVNLGEVRVSRTIGASDVFGEPVNVASRVEGQAEAGEVLFTEAVYLAMNRAEVPAEEVGYRTLKGVPEAVRLYRAGRGPYALASAAGGERDAVVDAPPYGNEALARVKGLAAPDPLAIARAPHGAPDVRAVASRLAAAGAGIARGASALRNFFPPPAQRGEGRERGAYLSRLARRLRVILRGRRAAVAGAVGFALVAGVALAFIPTREERLIAAGRFEEAREAIAELSSARGAGDGRVLYLRARLADERWRRGEAGPREAFNLYGRALAAGSAPARRALAHEARSDDCSTRRLAAHALADSHSADAAGALRDLAAAEPEAPAAKDALEGVKRLFGADGRCGAGDVARDALRALGEGT
jgi:class 3 adenylate cyclase